MNLISFGSDGNNTISHFLGGGIITSDPFGDITFADNFSMMKNHVKMLLDKHSFDVALVDMHPGFHSRAFAKTLGIPMHDIQHHVAHAYSAAHEHGLTDFIGIVADGLGYSNDGTIWGGEVFHNKKRIGRLEHHYQPGGDSATRNPARMLFSILSGFMESHEIGKIMRKYLTEKEMSVISKQMMTRYNSPATSSCGRVLDAASVLLGFCNKMTYTGEPAILLQDNSAEPYHMNPVVSRNDIFVLRTGPLFKFLTENANKDKHRLAATVQAYLAHGFMEIARAYNPSLPIVFSGGCAYNRIMSGIMKENGALMNKNIEPGDQGISYGQIACRLANPGNDDT